MDKAQQFIWDRSFPEPNSGCWIWMLCVDKWGYGDTKTSSAHRRSYAAFKGPIGDGLLVRHTCDMPCCVNPDHLLTGTVLDNVRDKVRRGRARGRNSKPKSGTMTTLSRE